MRFCKITPKILMISISFLFFLFSSGCGLYYYPDFDPASLQKSNENLETCKVTEVIDGDTIIIDNNKAVRLIGINTPEKGMYFYLESREALKLIIDGAMIVLEEDISETDKYGRWLRYVYLENPNGLFVNLEMVKRGFANAYTYPPDVKYTEDFIEAERYARKNKLGLWEKSEEGSVEVSLNYDAEGNDNENLNGEYAILKNTGGSSINLRGWTLKDSGTAIYKIGNHILKPGSKLYIYSGEGEDNQDCLYWNSRTGIWNNDHDTLYLRDSEGLLVEIYNY